MIFEPARNLRLMILSKNKVTTIPISAETSANLAPCRYSNAFITYLTSIFLAGSGVQNQGPVERDGSSYEVNSFNGEPYDPNNNYEN